MLYFIIPTALPTLHNAGMAPYLLQQHFIETELARYQAALDDRLDLVVPGDVEAVLRCIHEHLFNEELNVTWVLAQCGIRSNTFQARFKYYCRMRLAYYIQTERIKAAVHLMKYEVLDLCSIAFSVGYRSYNTFARAFKRCKACSPAAFRESYRCTRIELMPREEAHLSEPIQRTRPEALASLARSQARPAA